MKKLTSERSGDCLGFTGLQLEPGIIIIPCVKPNEKGAKVIYI